MGSNDSSIATMPFMSAEHRATLERMMSSNVCHEEESSYESSLGKFKQQDRVCPEVTKGQNKDNRRNAPDTGDDDGSVSSSFDEEDLEEANVPPESTRQQAKEVQQSIQTSGTGFRMSRLLFLVCLLVVGVVVSVTTFLTIREQETKNGVQRFEMTVTTVEDYVRFRASFMARALADLNDRFTAQAISTKSEFPEVTLPYFEVSAGRIRRSTLLDVVVYAPLVEENERGTWEHYASLNMVQLGENLEVYASSTNLGSAGNIAFTNFTYQRDSFGDIIAASGTSPWLPLWHISPPVGTEEHVNFNLLSVYSTDLQALFYDVKNRSRALMAPAAHVPELHHVNPVTNNTSGSQSDVEQSDSPQIVFMSPVYSGVEKATRAIGGVTVGIISWNSFFSDLDLVEGIVYTLEVANGPTNVYAATGRENATRLHTIPSPRQNSFSAVVQLCPGNCATTANPTSIYVYATATYNASFQSWKPGVFAAVAAAGFASLAIAFLLYDRDVQRQTTELRATAERTTALVSSLFPANVHDRLFNSKMSENAKEKRRKSPNKTQTCDMNNETYAETANSVPSFDVDHDEEKEQDNDDFFFKSKPIADFFPSTTIMFADLAGFTGWSSSREPHQVFVLLETVYRAFDVIAKQRGVFKVETVGDCYVAVCGLPRPRNDHAIVMAKFARDCIRKMHQLVKKLEARLGPDTGDLQVRVGLHSGPVTGGVLRGEGSRFQLFGDSMNTASRIETTGEPNKIHISQATADLLIAAGKEKWLRLREVKIYAKGKGEMQTYWLKTGRSTREASRSSASDSCVLNEDDDDENSSIAGTYADDDDSYEDSLNISDDLLHDMVSEKTARLIEWNVDLLQRLLKQVLAHRQDSGIGSNKQYWRTVTNTSRSLLEEVEEAISFPPLDHNALRSPIDKQVEAIKLDPTVERQLRDFVTNIAIMYRNNPYHNFEHASQVTLSVNKYLSCLAYRCKELVGGEAEVMWDPTIRITSDPLTPFALVFSALILDVDHAGVPNSRLVKERRELSRAYGTKSMAESNSFRLAWDLLMDHDYKELRQTLCATKEETIRFRQIVLHCVLATDVSDPEIQSARNVRWERAFSGSVRRGGDRRDKLNEQVTAVLELLIQLADLSHATQHYQVYCKWSERLFMEMFKAHREGRVGENPADHWFESQRLFFHDVVIPMATKLQDCDVFGSSSNEVVDYARKHLEQWEQSGKDTVRSMARKAEASVAAKDLVATRDLSLTNRNPETNDFAGSRSSAGDLHREGTPLTTVKVGDKDVSTSSLTMALSSLMLQVQQMAMQEESLLQSTMQDATSQHQSNDSLSILWADQR